MIWSAEKRHKEFCAWFYMTRASKRFRSKANVGVPNSVTLLASRTNVFRSTSSSTRMYLRWSLTTSLQRLSQVFLSLMLRQRQYRIPLYWERSGQAFDPIQGCRSPFHSFYTPQTHVEPHNAEPAKRRTPSPPCS